MSEEKREELEKKLFKVKELKEKAVKKEKFEAAGRLYKTERDILGKILDLDKNKE